MSTASDVSGPGIPGARAGRSAAGRSPRRAMGSMTAWREDMLIAAAELDTLAALLAEGSPVAGAARTRLLDGIREHTTELRTAARSGTGPVAAFSGVHVTRCLRNVHAAQVGILRLAPLQYVDAQLAVLQDHAHRSLERGEPLRARIDRLVKTGVTSEGDRETLIAIVTDVQAEERRSIARVRSFRNVLLLTAGALALGAAGLGVVGAVSPQTLPLCFEPGADVVCPTAANAVGDAGVPETIRRTVSAWDIVLVEIVGVLAAGLAAAAALRRVRGTSTPYSVPVALAVLKLPMGALTAVLGLLLMRGDFVPGLSALDTSGQIVAWAVVFGYSQQVFTRLVDDQGQSVLDRVGKPSTDTGPGSSPAVAGAHH